LADERSLSNGVSETSGAYPAFGTAAAAAAAELEYSDVRKMRILRLAAL